MNLARLGRLGHLGRACLLVGLAAGLSWPCAWAANFELAVNPSRVEVGANSGQRLGQSIELHNLGARDLQVAVRTIDWHLSEDGELNFFDALQPGSCRPWVLLERPRVTVPAGGNRSFRFQVEVPPDAARGECRFMVAIEGVEPAQSAAISSGGTSLALPVTGRIAVAVYVRINDAQAQLQVQQLALRSIQGRRTPVVLVHNAGDAHGRLDGVLDATDAAGQALTLTVDGTPVLPGQTRALPLTVRDTQDKPTPAPQWPLKIQGRLEWERGGFKVDAQLP